MGSANTAALDQAQAGVTTDGTVLTSPGQCFHCGLPVPDRLVLNVVINGASRSMCCHGCAAVADAIIASGHDNFYRVRTELSPSAQQTVPDFLRLNDAFDTPEIADRYVQSLDDNHREASLILEGITCAACIWLNERHLATLPGVERVAVNYSTQRVLLRWDQRRIRLGEILRAIQDIGYRALPYNPNQQQASRRRQRRYQQRRLAVAGLFGMQVMMLSISLYAGGLNGMEQSFVQLFRWLCLLLTLPVVLYAAQPFFVSAWRNLKTGSVGMNLPVALAIGIAFASSVFATFDGEGEIYFDSVVMFVFFLTASQYFENMARQRCALTIEKLAQALPLVATRLSEDGAVESVVAAATLAIGDRVLLRPGVTVPADGRIVSGFSAFDESLLNGESMPVEKHPGARLFGGSINITNPLQMVVGAVGRETVLAEIERSIVRAEGDKPPLARLADRVAGGFILSVLLIVIGVAFYWWQQDATRWFDIALAVLIVSCPCALSLATPAALSATLGKMQEMGLLVKQGGALESLNRVSHVVFDKTGTLTRGKPVVQQVICASGQDRERCLRLAATLEQHSEHPLAIALVRAADALIEAEVSEIESVAGGGLRASFQGRQYFIGKPEFVAACGVVEVPAAWLRSIQDRAVSTVVLSDCDEVLAMFTFTDELRADAPNLIANLQKAGKKVSLMTGDRKPIARHVAACTGISDYQFDLSPQQKMAAVQRLQAQGATVLMVGDGVNDAPVLACANVSIAMGSASALARTSADIVLIGNHLQMVSQAFAMARRTQKIIRQNMVWALGYNFTAIPLAALGLVVPWLAALGMSLSSLLVVLNALRLAR